MKPSNKSALNPLSDPGRSGVQTLRTRRIRKAAALRIAFLAVFWLTAILANAADASARRDAPPVPLAREVASIVESYHARGEFPGAVIAVEDQRGERALVTSGSANAPGERASIDSDVPSYIGSVTKTFVAVVILQLVQEERIDLTQSVESIRPGLPGGAAITIRDLLQHTSGLNEYIDTPELQGDANRPWSADELTQLAIARGAVGSPGASHRYANTNYLVLGDIIERVTGLPWYAEVRTRVLDPLQMRSTAYPDEGRDDRVGQGYRRIGGVFSDTYPEWHHSVGGAAGGMYSTASDLLRFARALRDGGLLDESVRAAMRSFVPAENYGYVRHEYGLGVEHYIANEVTIEGHLGVASAHSSFVGFDPDSGIAVAVLTNCQCEEPPALMAAELIGTLTSRSSGPPNPPSASFGYTYFPYARLDDSGGEKQGDVQITKFDASISQSLEFNDGRTQLTGSLDYQRLEYDYRGFEGSENLQSVQSISLGLALVQEITEKWGLLLIASPGYADDFEGRITTDAAYINVIGAGTYRFSEDLEVGLGVAGLTALGEFQPLPVASLKWRAAENLWLDIIAPVSAELTWLPADRLGVQASVVLEGNSFHGARGRYDVDNPQVNYSAVTAELAARWYVLPWLHVTAHGGYTLDRRFEFSDGRKTVPGGKFDLADAGVFGIQIGFGG